MLVFYLSMLDDQPQRDRFESLYRNYRGLLYHEAFAVTKNRELAEYVVHETFLHLIRIIDELRFDRERELVSFLRLITHNRAVDFLRKQGRALPTEDELLASHLERSQPDPESVAINELMLEQAVETVMNMDPAYRTPLTLKVQGYSIREIARILEIGEGAVKTRLHRARKILLASMEDPQ